jgi:hypothetical protein
MDAIFCNGCGALLEEAPTLLPDQRPPCPRCGSLARRIMRTVKSNILGMPGVPLATVERTIGVDAVLQAQTAEAVQIVEAHGIPGADQ